jgi:hypothetical protein
MAYDKNVEYVLSSDFMSEELEKSARLIYLSSIVKSI